MQVKIFTNPKDVEERIDIARHSYRARNLRMESLTDESVDTFYSCLLCQSFAPNHVCVITPERLGLCGAYNWLDGKAAYEIDPTGPNQPLIKGECHRPGARAVGRHQRLRLRQLQADPGALQCLLAAGRSHDQLRLL